MIYKKKITKIGLIALTCVMMGTVPVSATTESFSFIFNSTESALPVNSGYKNDTRDLNSSSLAFK